MTDVKCLPQPPASRLRCWYLKAWFQGQTHRWRDLSFGCTSTNSTTRNRIRATEMAVDSTMDKAGIPSGKVGSLSVRQIRVDIVVWTELTVFIHQRVKMCCLILFTLLQEAAELHLAVPFPILTGKVFIISLQNVAFVTKIFNHSAMRESSAWGRVAGVAPVLWLIWRLANCPWKKKKEKKKANQC